MKEKLDELILFLKELGIEEVKDEEKKILLSRLESGENMDILKRELQFLLSLNRILITSYSKVSVENMDKINKSIDVNLLLKLFVEHNKINDRKKDTIDSLKAFRSFAYEALNNNSKFNNLINQNIVSSFSKVAQLRQSLYLSMLDSSKVDALLRNCMRRSKLFLDECDALNLERLVECLKKNYLLNDDELVEISKNCASFFAFSSASKLKNISNTIERFRDYIYNNLKFSNSSIDASMLLNKDFKDILMNSASVAINNSDSIENTVKFLCGHNLGDLLDTPRGFRTLKGSFTPLELAKIYNESITSLSISVDKIADICANISECYKNCFGKDLDLNGFINGRNFASMSQLSKEDYDASYKLKIVFDLLKMFVSSEDMENLLKNNFSFLMASVGDIRSSLKEAILNSKDKDELNKNVLKKIKSHFGMNKNSSKVKNGTSGGKLNNKVTIKIGSLNNVSIKDISYDELEEILKKLDVKEEDIKKWKKEWNSDDYLNKTIEDLEILENIDKELDELDSFTHMNFSDIESFTDEMILARDIYLGLKDTYEKMIENNILDEELLSLNDIVKEKMFVIGKKIDDNINYILSFYNSQIDNLNKRLQKLKEDEKTYLANAEEMSKIDKFVEENNLSYERALEEKKEMLELVSFLEKKAKEGKKVLELDDKVARLTDKFYGLLSEKVMKDNSIIEINKSEMISTLFALFVKTLYEEGVIVYDPVIEHAKKYEDIKTYNQFKEIFLTSKEAKISDKIYEYFKSNSFEKTKKVIDDDFTKMIGKYGIKIDDESFKEKYTLLSKYASSRLEELADVIDVYKRLYSLELHNVDVDINKLRENIKQLEENISNYVKKINSLMNKSNKG